MYFDWNATTPLAPEVKDVYLAALEEDWRNPGSPSAAAARVSVRLAEAREKLASLLGGEAEDWIFTSGATESNNLILRSAAGWSSSAALWVSAIEHPSILEAAEAYAPGRVKKIPVTKQGQVSLSWMEEAIEKDRPVLISVMAANNETGIVQPWREIQAMADRFGISFHCDAAQWIGKMPVSGLERIGFVTVSGHKFCGPKGVGALRIQRGVGRLAGNYGGPQENNHRGGTENVPAVLAMIAALEQAIKHPLGDQEAKERKAFEALCRQTWGDEVRLIGLGVERLPNTVSICLPKHHRDRWIRHLDRLGFEVSSGSACSTGDRDRSGVLQAMGMDNREAERTIRISSGPAKDSDWIGLHAALVQTWQTLEAEKPNLGTLIDLD